MTLLQSLKSSQSMTPVSNNTGTYSVYCRLVVIFIFLFYGYRRTPQSRKSQQVLYFQHNNNKTNLCDNIERGLILEELRSHIPNFRTESNIITNFPQQRTITCYRTKNHDDYLTHKRTSQSKLTY